MSTATTPATDRAEHGLHPAARLSTTLRVAAATTLVLGTGLHAAAWLVYSQPNLTTTYSSVAGGAVRPDLSTALFILGIPFWIASILRCTCSLVAAVHPDWPGRAERCWWSGSPCWPRTSAPRS